MGVIGLGRGGGGNGEGAMGFRHRAMDDLLDGALGSGRGTIGHEAGASGRQGGGFAGRSASAVPIRSGKVDVRGSLSAEVIRRVVNRHLNEVRFCFEQEPNARSLRGRVQVRFVIAPSGAVQTVAVTSSTITSRRLGNCIMSAVRRWTFPTPEPGQSVVVSYPFDFGPP
jgi:TonB family protein